MNMMPSVNEVYGGSLKGVCEKISKMLKVRYAFVEEVPANKLIEKDNEVDGFETYSKVFVDSWEKLKDVFEKCIKNLDKLEKEYKEIELNKDEVIAIRCKMGFDERVVYGVSVGKYDNDKDFVTHAVIFLETTCDIKQIISGNGNESLKGGVHMFLGDYLFDATYNLDYEKGKHKYLIVISFKKVEGGYEIGKVKCLEIE
jgi:uncharacterized protein (UPF0335 family)